MYFGTPCTCKSDTDLYLAWCFHLHSDLCSLHHDTDQVLQEKEETAEESEYLHQTNICQHQGEQFYQQTNRSGGGKVDKWTIYTRRQAF